jgi:Cu/Ag efflux protein CusF
MWAVFLLYWVFSMALFNSCAARVAALALTSAALIAPAQAQQAQSTGEVRRVDAAQGKITIKHGAIPDLSLPAMSLAYQAAPALLKDIKPGDKVRFTARRDNDHYVIVQISK